MGTKTLRIKVEGFGPPVEKVIEYEEDPTKDDATKANELIEIINRRMGNMVQAQRVTKTHRVLNFKTGKDGDDNSGDDSRQEP